MAIQWSLVLFSSLAGAGAWLFVFLGIGEARGSIENAKSKTVASILSLVLLIVGGLCSVTHLSHPERVMEALGHPTSGIFMEALFIGLSCIVIAIYLVMVRRNASASALKVVAVIGAVITLVLTFVLGYSYIIPARPMWDTFLLPLSYMATAIPAGAALYLLTLHLGGERKESLVFAGTLLVVSGIIAVIVPVLYGFVSGAFGADQALLLWIVALVCAGAGPIVSGYMIKKNSDKAMMWSLVAIVTSVIGCIAFRCIMWVVGAGLDDFFKIPLD